MISLSKKYEFKDKIMLRDKLNDAIKSAMKDQKKLRLAILRLIYAAIKDRDIANRGEGKEPASDEEIKMLLLRMIKQRNESIKLYLEAGRKELADNEQEEIGVIQEFLPRQMAEEEINKAVEQAVVETHAEGLRDIGKVIAWLKERYNGQMDFAKANHYIRVLYSSKDA